ncbi:MAG: Fic family protein [Bacilli bacterium]|nr:Fic family protein [Bacilli bacterium]
MDLKKQYYKLSKDEFDSLLNGLKNNPVTKHFDIGNNKYFYYQDPSITPLLVEINKLQVKFDSLIGLFSNFGISQLVQSFLLKEIEATNKIENIYSTRHDIYSVINKLQQGKNKKLLSIVNSYSALLKKEFFGVNKVEDLRIAYDSVLSSSIKKSDMPDGRLFRKGPVYISNGLEDVLKGVAGEENIIKSLDCFLKVYDGDGDIYERMCIGHFLLETTHPFYDGNGRLGRFLFSNRLFKENGTLFAFLISSAFAKNKSKYYRSLEDGNDIHQFGSINQCVEGLLKILIKELNEQLVDLNDKLTRIRNISPIEGLTKTERRMYSFLMEATVLSDFGVSNEEIIKELDISKRTLMYSLEKFRGLGLIEDTKFGKFTYHKIDMQ